MYPWNSSSRLHISEGTIGKATFNSLPNDEILRRRVFGFPDANFILDIGGIQRGGYLQNHVVRIQFWVEIRPEVYCVFYAGFGRFGNMGLQAEREIDITGGPVSR